MISTVLAAFVALAHIGFLCLEMFLWDKPAGLKIFCQDLDFARRSKVLAANQGLYNGFLAAGLIWGLCHPDPHFGRQILMFFLGCVIVAGLYGAATFSRRILWVQATPAIAALVAMLLDL